MYTLHEIMNTFPKFTCQQSNYKVINNCILFNLILRENQKHFWQ